MGGGGRETVRERRDDLRELPRDAPLFPRMKQSPYLFFSCPSTYSSVCSIAMFMNPSKHANIPRYVTPEFNCTMTGFPSTCFRKSDGDFFVGPADDAAVAAAVVVLDSSMGACVSFFAVDANPSFESDPCRAPCLRCLTCKKVQTALRAGTVRAADGRKGRRSGASW